MPIDADIERLVAQGIVPPHHSHYRAALVRVAAAVAAGQEAARRDVDKVHERVFLPALEVGTLHEAWVPESWGRYETNKRLIARTFRELIGRQAEAAPGWQDRGGEDADAAIDVSPHATRVDKLIHDIETIPRLHPLQIAQRRQMAVILAGFLATQARAIGPPKLECLAPPFIARRSSCDSSAPSTLPTSQSPERLRIASVSSRPWSWR